MTAVTFPVEYSHIMMFARSIGDENPLFTDPEAAAASSVGGIIAPPTFGLACAQFDPGFGLRPKPGQAWFGSGKEPTGVKQQAGDGGGGGALHAEQHFEYHKPIRAGDVLTCRMELGATWEKDGKRGGRLVFREYVTEYHNQDGELALTARSISVTPERPADAS